MKNFIFLLLAFFFFPLPNVKGEAPPSCTPAESNDCLIKNATVVNNSKIQVQWQKIKIKIGHLPTDSWYVINKAEPEEYELVVYPDIGKHYILGHHDFGIVINIKKIDRPLTGLTCTAVVKPEDVWEQKLKNSNWDITIKNDLNYFYHGGPGSNPNPFTSEVRKILKEVWDTIRIGKC